jgi:hypothetical protein
MKLKTRNTITNEPVVLYNDNKLEKANEQQRLATNDKKRTTAAKGPRQPIILTTTRRKIKRKNASNMV